MTDYTLFPGCVIQNRIPFIEASAKYVFDTLGVGHSPGEFACCPNPVGLKQASKKSWLAMTALNLAEAEKANKPVMTLCNGCYQSLACGKHDLKHDPVLKDDVNKVLSKVGKEFKGTVDVKHFVTVLMEEVGLDKIKAAIKKPLSGLKVACHPGCHYARPSHILDGEGEDPFDLKYLRQLVEATGATVVDYAQENLCCGNSVRNRDEFTANNMLKDKVHGAMDSGADCLAVNCPACFQQFEGEQRKIKTLSDAREGEKYMLPTMFVTELLAIAMGKSANDIGVKFHRNKSKEFLEKVN